MPSETVYLPDRDRDHVERVREANGHENLSQALQQIVADHRRQVYDD